MQGRHLVHFYHKNPNTRGPVELLLLEVGREWRKAGGSISAYFIADPPDWYAEMLRDAGVAFGAMRVSDKASWRSEIGRIASLEQPDIAHIHFGWHECASLTRRGAVVVRTEHSERAPKRLELLRRLARHVRQRQLAGFIAVSEFLNVQTQRDFLVGPSRVRTIYNGVDQTWFRPRPPLERAFLRQKLFGICDDRVVITQAAWLVGRKRQAMLIEAMPPILAAAPNALLVLAGGGDDEGRLRGLIHDLGLSENVLLLTNDNNVAEIYAASDIATLVSSSEGLGASAVEALAVGLPVLVAPNGGLVEVVEDGISGLLLKDQTAEGVAAALTTLILDPELRNRLGEEALVRVKKLFDMRESAESTVSYYNGLLAKRP